MFVEANFAVPLLFHHRQGWEDIRDAPLISLSKLGTESERIRINEFPVTAAIARDGLNPRRG
jgi:hypothetical protein